MLKLTCTYLSQAFNFDFVDSKFENKTKLPVASLAMSERNKIEVRLTRNTESPFYSKEDALEKEHISVSKF